MAWREWLRCAWRLDRLFPQLRRRCTCSTNKWLVTSVKSTQIRLPPFYHRHTFHATTPSTPIEEPLYPSSSTRSRIFPFTGIVSLSA